MLTPHGNDGDDDVVDDERMGQRQMGQSASLSMVLLLYLLIVLYGWRWRAVCRWRGLDAGLGGRHGQDVMFLGAVWQWAVGCHCLSVVLSVLAGRSYLFSHVTLY